MNNLLHVGLDVGSTTVKIAVMDNNLNTIYTSYQRHNSDTKNTVCKVLEELVEKYKDKELEKKVKYNLYKKGFSLEGIEEILNKRLDYK